ncbi:unnamed protein product [Rotaria magnacalcarata]
MILMNNLIEDKKIQPKKIRDDTSYFDFHAFYYIYGRGSSMASLQAELASVKARTITACRICFQETEGSSQCQGHRHSCSGWSIHPEWTLPFRDDTDNRPGGCFYQWKLECLKGI